MKRCLACHAAWPGASWSCPDCGRAPEFVDAIPCFAPDLADTIEGYRSEHFQALAQLEDGSFWFRARNRLVIWALQRFAAQAGSFLEVGCGTGFVLREVASRFTGMRVAGSEVLIDGLGYASGRLPGAEFLQMDAREMPFVEEFDAIGLFDVLEHITEDTVVLGEVARSLRPGGVAVVTVPQHEWLWSAADLEAGHARRYRAEDLVRKVAAAGLVPVLTTSFMSAPVLAMIVNRRLLGRTDLGDEHRPRRRLGPIIDACLSVELRLIQAGIRLPVGGSLLVVAEKPNPS